MLEKWGIYEFRLNYDDITRNRYIGETRIFADWSGEHTETVSLVFYAVESLEIKPVDHSRVVVGAVDLARAKAGELGTVDIGGGVKLDLCGIPAGGFLMGSPDSGKNRFSDETQHHVTLTKPFWLGRTQVTQSQWQAVMGSNPEFFDGKDLPVERVSWYAATEFLRKLNAKDLLAAGWKFALPSEAQWEIACRAGTSGEYAGILEDMAWFKDNSGGKIHPVATKKPNAWGLYDMHGNVWEWCADWLAPYSTFAVSDPIGPNTGSNRVARGGSWFIDGPDCRSARRSGFTPDFRNLGIGFRVAAVPSP